jgi:hypothetical protein
MLKMSTCAAKKYSATDLETLASSKDKRARFVEVHTGSIVPSLRTMADLIRRNLHYLELPPPSALAPFFVTSGIDLANSFGHHQLNGLFFTHCAFVDGWAPIIQRWADDNFSIMQPTEPDFSHALVMTMGMMVAAAGQKEEKLQVSIWRTVTWLQPWPNPSRTVLGGTEWSAWTWVRRAQVVLRTTPQL